MTFVNAHEYFKNRIKYYINYKKEVDKKMVNKTNEDILKYLKEDRKAYLENINPLFKALIKEIGELRVDIEVVRQQCEARPQPVASTPIPMSAETVDFSDYTPTPRNDMDGGIVEGGSTVANIKLNLKPLEFTEKAFRPEEGIGKDKEGRDVWVPISKMKGMVKRLQVSQEVLVEGWIAKKFKVA